MLIICNLLHRVNIEMLKMGKIFQNSLDKCSKWIYYVCIKAHFEQRVEEKCSQV